MSRKRKPGAPWELFDEITVGGLEGYATQVVDGKLRQAYFPHEHLILGFETPEHS